MFKNWKVGLSVLLSVSTVLLLIVTRAPAQGNPGGPPGGLNVNVANFPAVQSVEDIHRPWLQPYQKQSVGQIPPSTSNGQINFDVPAGKRLVIEQVSVGINGDPGENYSVQVVIRDENGVPVSYDLNPPVPGRFIGSNRRFSVSASIRLYADQLTPVTVVVARSGSSATENWLGAVSGYLVDID